MVLLLSELLKHIYFICIIFTAAYAACKKNLIKILYFIKKHKK